jgi:dTDP-4-dehydrorhamnose reductase
MAASGGTTLIVGGDGKVGRALAEHIARAGQRVVTTTRRPAPGSGGLFLDLAGEVENWPIPEGLTTAILCAAIPLIDACEKDPAGTARVNVTGMLALIRRLVERNIFTVFLSTNQVFDGTIPHVGPETPQRPRTEYGRQKVRVEQQMLQAGGPRAVVRFAKILEPATPLFRSWRETLRAGGTITPFVDMRMAPVPLATAVSALRLISDRRAEGIWQVSGARDLSYAEAATMLAGQLGVAPALVRPMAARESGRVTTHLPAHTTLCVDRLRREFGLEPPSVEWTVRDAFGDGQGGGGR